MLIFRINLLLLCCFISTKLLGQLTNTYSYIRYTVDDGIPGMSVFGISQDSERYIWLTTNRGISSFNGATFTNTKFQETEFPQSAVRVFKLPRNNFLFIKDYTNKVYIMNQNSCQSFLLPIPKLKSKQLSQSSIDSSISIWSGKKLYYLSERQLNLHFSFETKSNVKHTFIYNFKYDSLFVSTNKAAFLLSKDTIQLPQLRGASCAFNAGDSSYIFVRNKIYSLASNGIRLLDSLTNINTSIQHALVDNDGNLWFAGRNRGLYLYRNGEIEPIANSFGIDGDQITYLFLDVTGNVWISTASSGLICVLKSKFHNYSTLDGLLSNNTTSITDWRNSVLIASNAGLSHINNNKVKKLTNEIAYVHQLYNAKGKLLVSSEASNFTFNRLEQKQVYLVNFRIAELIEDTLYLGNWNKLKKVVLDSVPQTIQTAYFDEHKLYRKYFLKKSSHGNRIFIGSSNGLFETNRSFAYYKAVHIPQFQQDNVSFFDAIEDSIGNLWFASSNGLFFLGANNQWKHFQEKDGLPSSYLSSIEIDNRNCIWLGTDKGLVSYHRGDFSSFNKSNGLISDYINVMHYQVNTNDLWIGTPKGVSKLDLADELLYQSTNSTSLKIDAFEIIGKNTYQRDSIPELSYDDNNIRIHYSSISYSNPSDFEYRYRVLPLDSNWHQSPVHVLEFIGLRSMSYEVQLKCKTSGSQWSLPISLHFTIAPPYWRQTSVVLLFTLVVILLLSIALKLYLNRLNKKLSREKESLLREKELQQQVLSMTMNPHFIFNSLSSIQSYFSKSRNTEMSEYIAKFSKLIRSNMEASKENFISMNDELKRLQLYVELEQKRMDKALDFQIDVSATLRQRNPNIPSMILQPLIENSIWHGIMPSNRSGRILLKIDNRDNIIFIRIFDNGIGFRKASINKKPNHKSRGISILKERLHLLSSDNFIKYNECYDEQEILIGTEVSIRINY